MEKETTRQKPANGAREERALNMAEAVDASVCRVVRKHGLGHHKVRPVLGEVIRAKLAPRDLPFREPFNSHAVLWGKPPLARCPVRDVSDVVVPEGASHSGRAAEVLHNPLRGGPHEVRVCIHGRQSNLVSRTCLT
jgi:hypothetical protein